jgi:pyridoxal phosphate enzyme (YggS family)
VNFDRLRSNLAAVRERIVAACHRAKRDPSGVTLIVVTKSVPAPVIPRLAELGVGDIGENRPVEAMARVASLCGFRRHMIGHLQTNKLQKTLAWADLIHSVDRPSLLGALEHSNKKVPIFVQVNVSREASKGGYDPEQAEAAVAEARRTLDVRGLMTMAPEGVDPRPHFRRLSGLAARIGVPGLSMGMSQDYEVGVEEGATHVRIGTAIFEGVFI